MGKRKVKFLYDLISKNKYINKKVTNKKPKRKISQGSLRYLVKRELTQSQCIKLGYAVEKLLSDLVLSLNKDITSIKVKPGKGEKETDHLFLYKNQIIFSEIKTNLNLDTEKTKSTVDKCKSISEKLKEMYPEKVNWKIVGARYATRVPKATSNKFKCNQVCSVNEYLELFDTEFKFTESEYQKWINCIAETMFKNKVNQLH